MEIQVHTHNLDAGDRVREHIQRKLEPLARHVRNLPEVKVELKREATRSAQDQMVVQMTVVLNDTVLRAEERAPTVDAAVEAAADVLDRQLLRYKGRHYRNLEGRRAGRNAALHTAGVLDVDEGEALREVAAPEGELELPGRVVRLKRFSLKPLSVEEAARQMELLGHTFFFFLNSATDRYNVLYRRRDGDYGLIEPEAG